MKFLFISLLTISAIYPFVNSPKNIQFNNIETYISINKNNIHCYKTSYQVHDANITISYPYYCYVTKDNNIYFGNLNSNKKDLLIYKIPKKHKGFVGALNGSFYLSQSPIVDFPASQRTDSIIKLYPGEPELYIENMAHRMFTNIDGYEFLYFMGEKILLRENGQFKEIGNPKHSYPISQFTVIDDFLYIPALEDKFNSISKNVLIEKINLKTKEVKTIAQLNHDYDNMESFYWKDNTLYYIVRENNPKIVCSFDLNTKVETSLKKIDKDYYNHLIIYEVINNEVYLLNFGLEENKSIYENDKVLVETKHCNLFTLDNYIMVFVNPNFPLKYKFILLDKNWNVVFKSEDIIEWENIDTITIDSDKLYYYSQMSNTIKSSNLK